MLSNRFFELRLSTLLPKKPASLLSAVAGGPLLRRRARRRFANQFDAPSTKQVKEPTSTTIPEMRQCFDIAVVLDGHEPSLSSLRPALAQSQYAGAGRMTFAVPRPWPAFGFDSVAGQPRTERRGHSLTLAAREGAHGGLGPRLRFELGEKLRGAARHGGVVHDAEAGDPPPQLAAEKDVGCAREIVGKRQILVDHLDAGVARILRPAKARPSKCMVPWVGGKFPAMTLTNVDLPAPLSPMRPTISPEATL